MTDRKQLAGMAAALGANLIFGFSFIFAKLALGVASPLIILASRFSVAFLVMNLLLLTGKVKLNFKGKKKGGLILMAVMQPLLYFIFETYGLDRVSSALSGVIIALVPVAACAFAVIFLKEKPTFLQVACTIVSIAAIAAISIISNDGSKNHTIGVILLIGAVVCAGMFNILSRGESARFSPFERTYAMLLAGSVGYILMAAIGLGKDFLPQTASAFCEPKFLIAMLYLGALSSVGAFMLYNYSTSVISTVRSSSFSNIITVVTVLAGVLILGDSFSVWEYLLCAVIILGVWGVNVFTRKEQA